MLLLSLIAVGLSAPVDQLAAIEELLAETESQDERKVVEESNIPQNILRPGTFFPLAEEERVAISRAGGRRRQRQQVSGFRDLLGRLIDTVNNFGQERLKPRRGSRNNDFRNFGRQILNSTSNLILGRLRPREEVFMQGNGLRELAGGLLNVLNDYGQKRLRPRKGSRNNDLRNFGSQLLTLGNNFAQQRLRPREEEEEEEEALIQQEIRRQLLGTLIDVFGNFLQQRMQQSSDNTTSALGGLLSLFSNLFQRRQQQPQEELAKMEEVLMQEELINLANDFIQQKLQQKQEIAREEKVAELAGFLNGLFNMNFTRGSNLTRGSGFRWFNRTRGFNRTNFFRGNNVWPRQPQQPRSEEEGVVRILPMPNITPYRADSDGGPINEEKDEEALEQSFLRAIAPRALGFLARRVLNRRG